MKNAASQILRGCHRNIWMGMMGQDSSPESYLRKRQKAEDLHQSGGLLLFEATGLIKFVVAHVRVLKT